MIKIHLNKHYKIFKIKLNLIWVNKIFRYSNMKWEILKINKITVFWDPLFNKKEKFKILDTPIKYSINLINHLKIIRKIMI